MAFFALAASMLFALRALFLGGMLLYATSVHNSQVSAVSEYYSPSITFDWSAWITKSLVWIGFCCLAFFVITATRALYKIGTGVDVKLNRLWLVLFLIMFCLFTFQGGHASRFLNFFEVNIAAQYFVGLGILGFSVPAIFVCLAIFWFLAEAKLKWMGARNVLS